MNSRSSLLNIAGCSTDRKRSAFLGRWFRIANGQHSLRIDELQPLCIHAWDVSDTSIG